MSALLQTEYPFSLPRGYVDENGDVHREGRMRLATAADEILPYRDERVQANPAYLVVILLSRVIDLDGVTISTRVVENLFASDLAYLQELYNQLNGNGESSLHAVCPACSHRFEVEVDRLGGS